MSSGSKSVTVGYWYRLLYHFGVSRGPVDAFLEFRAGDRAAWSGVMRQSGRLAINKPNLWGGEKSEGGLVGDLDVMLGEQVQQPNSYLAEQLGADQPAYRGKFSLVWRGGRWGAMNPYPKKASAKLRRILKGWDNDTPWYPEKAEIVLIPPDPLALYFSLDVSGSMGSVTGNGLTRLANLQSAVNNALQMIADVLSVMSIDIDIMVVAWSDDPDVRVSNIKRRCTVADIAALKSFVSGVSLGNATYFPAGLIDMAPFFAGAPTSSKKIVIFSTDGAPGSVSGAIEPEVVASDAAALVRALPGVSVYGINIALADTTFTAYVDNTPDDGVPVIAGDNPDAITSIILSAIGGLVAMNPIHILYDTLTAKDMMGEPAGMIADSAWRAAADKCWLEGLGLCTSYDGTDASDIEDFQQRICDIIAANLTQSLSDGLYYVDLIRGDHVLEDLPLVTDDDIVEFSQEPSVISEQINQVNVEWFDPQAKQTRTTAPMQNLGAIQAAGRVIPKTADYPEICTEPLSLRLAARDLQAEGTPTNRFRLTLNRRLSIRLGQPFRLQYPAEGIADMVCVLADYEGGTLLDGKTRIVAVQDVFSFPDTVYVESQPGLSVPPDNLPIAAPHQFAIEAPYVELVANLSRVDLAAFPSDAGALMTVATRPSNGLNYSIFSGADGEELTDNGTAEWCPTALVVEEADRLETEFSLSDVSDLADVALGSWALWDTEIVRVDAIDLVALTISLGRACADTVPTLHAAGSRIYFCGDWAGTDDREYLDGETVRVKLLTRTSSELQGLSSAVQHSVVMSQRHFRPYPAANVKINGALFPESVTSPLGIIWSTRDRELVADKLLEWVAESVSSEPGVTWDVELLRDSDGGTVLSEFDVTTPAVNFITPFNGMARLIIRAKRDGLEALQSFNHTFLVGEVMASAIPAVRSGLSSFSGTASTTLTIPLPADYESGDYLLVALELPNTSVPATPGGWSRLAIAFGSSDSSVATDSQLLLYGKVASGSEGAALVVTASSTTFGAVVLVITKGTYKAPRGNTAVADLLGVVESGGVAVGRTTFSSITAPHHPFSGSWGGGRALWLSILGRKQSNLDPSGWPYPDYRYSVDSDSSAVPDCRISGQTFDTPPTLPVTPDAYNKSNNASASVINIAIRGAFAAERPECIYMLGTTSTSSSNLNLGTPTGAQVALAGDLQILVVMMFGAGSVSITPPAGFSLVQRYGTKIAVYKRVITGAETYPEAIAFSSAIAVIARVFTFPADTYAGTGEVLAAGWTGSTAAAVTPSVAGDSSWLGLRNYAIRIVVRDGAGGTTPVSAYPDDCPDLRGHSFTQGSSGSQVSFAVCGGVVESENAPVQSITMPNARAYEGSTIFVKGI